MRREILFLIPFALAGCMASDKRGPETVPATHAAYNPNTSKSDLAFHLARVERDPVGAIGWARLSGAYLKVSRDSDSNEMAIKAEDAARRSLAIRSRRNEEAATRLAESLLEQHRFQDALAANDKAVAIDPKDTTVLRQRAEIMLELGQYDEALGVMKQHPEILISPEGLALKAKAWELRGETDRCLSTWESAVGTVDKQLHTSPDAVAWFHRHYADALTRAGKTRDARSQYQRALELFPRDHRSFAGLARLSAYDNDWVAARSFGQQSLEIAKLTDVMSLMVQASLALNDVKGAQQLPKEIDKLNAETIRGFELELAHGHHHDQGSANHTHDRLYACYLADTNQNLPLAFHSAEEDLALRKDVYAYDTLAWVEYRQGSFGAAFQSIQNALRLGTKDPKILLHAGLIYKKVGKTEEGRVFLKRAIELPLLPWEKEMANEALATP